MKLFKNNQHKVGVSGYYKPTPSKWRKIGDNLLLLSTTLSALNIHSPHVAIAIQITGVLGKFLTNFFYE